MVTYNIRLDETKPGVQCTIQGVRQGEGGTRKINIVLVSNSTPVEIPDGSIVFLHCTKPDDNECLVPTTVDGNIIKAEITQQMCAAEGMVLCELKVYNADQSQVLYSAEFDVSVQAAISEAGVVSSNEYTALAGLVEDVQALKDSWGSAVATASSGDDTSVTVTLGNDAVSFDFTVERGAQGASAGFGTPTATASVLGPEDNPTVSVSASGTDDSKVFAFSFGIPRGEKGDTGSGLQIKGTYATLSALQAAVTDPETGDMYNVGASAPYNIYMFNGTEWEDQGTLKGEKGDAGDGVAAGGTSGQLLKKTSSADYDTEWASVTADDVGAECRRNLLDNWYFPSSMVINQRGKTGTVTFSDGDANNNHVVDRWKLTNGTATITDNGLVVNGTIVQVLEFAAGTSVTASVKMYSGEATSSYDNATKTFSITSSGGCVEAAKLEHGSTSTLLLDSPPDYNTELQKCMRYLFFIRNQSRFLRAAAVNANLIYFDMPMPIPMAAAPTLSYDSGAIKITSFGSSADQSAGFSFSVSAIFPYVFLRFNASKTGHGLTDATLNIANVLISAEL